MVGSTHGGSRHHRHHHCWEWGCHHHWIVLELGVRAVVVIVMDNIGDGDGRGCHCPFKTVLEMGVVIITVIG